MYSSSAPQAPSEKLKRNNNNNIPKDVRGRLLRESLYEDFPQRERNNNYSVCRKTTRGSLELNLRNWLRIPFQQPILKANAFADHVVGGEGGDEEKCSVNIFILPFRSAALPNESLHIF